MSSASETAPLSDQLLGDPDSGFGAFALSALLAMPVALASVGCQALRAALAGPAGSLKEPLGGRTWNGAAGLPIITMIRSSRPASAICRPQDRSARENLSTRFRRSMLTMKNLSRLEREFGTCIIICLSIGGYAVADGTKIPFDAEHWDLGRARIADHLGRNALMGTAFLKDTAFADGAIDVDIATTERTRSYPGVLFRVADPANYERFYIRPHRSPFYDDALQYGPVFNGVDSWQLYYGPGRTSGLEILPGRWNRLRIVVTGRMARVFWNDSAEPVLTVSNLARGVSAGSIGLAGPMDGTAYFSEVSVAAGETLGPPSLPAPDIMPGLISDWRISDPFSLAAADFTVYPQEVVDRSSWKMIPVDERGLADVSRLYPRKFRLGDAVVAKTVLTAEDDSLLRVGFGYSDFITVFLNRRQVYFGNSAYQSRDRSFLGIVGYNDNLFLPLDKGENELLIMVGEGMGGWAFCFRKEDEILADPSLKKEWTIEEGVALPEAVVYDPERDVLYVSNYFNEGREFISKVSTSGRMIEREWIKGLSMPTGMAVKADTLYAVDRSGLKVIDTSEGRIRETIPLAGMRVPNDVALAANGDLFLSDLPGDAVFRYSGGKLERWLDGLDGPNALLADKERLLVGQNGMLLSVDLADKSISVLARFDPTASIDGIAADGRGGYLVSDYHGKLYRLSCDGDKIRLLDTTNPGEKIADFALIPGRGLLVVPTFDANGLTAYSIKD
ncbi:MAG: hypothetical protein AB1714_02260 [Acidobacteriota bacterium]